MNHNYPEVKVGDVVLYKEAIEDGKKTSPDWPAIVYDVTNKTEGYLGLTVFRNGVPYRYQKVHYDIDGRELTWRARI